MNTVISRLPWLFCSLLTCSLLTFSLSYATLAASTTVSTTTPKVAPENALKTELISDENWLTNAQFVQAVTLDSTHQKQFLAVSESMGIGLLDQQGKVLSHIATNSEHLDFKWLPQSTRQGVLTTLDINSGNVQLIKVDFVRKTIALMIEYPPKNSAIEALCLGESDGKQHIELFTVGVNGEVKQMALTTPVNGAWRLIEINRFPVGPNIKSCAVDDVTNSLYISEENIGVWRYTTDPEQELIRTLLQLPAGLEVEYVDTTAVGDVAVVSPSTNRVWLLNHAANTFSPATLPSKLAPETVQISRIGERLTAFVFDDETQTNYQVDLGKQKVKTSKPLTSDPITSLPAYAQTAPVISYGDAADDPEIWVNTVNPSQSLIYGTDKRHGLNVYALNGKLRQSLAVGRVNNVDIRYNVKVNGEYVDIAAASNRTRKSISLFKIDRHTGLVSFLTDIQTDLADPYGLCMGQYNEQLVVWINDTDGRFQRYDLAFSDNRVKGTKSLEWTVPSQPEGCVSDDANKRLFYGEESTGVWLKQLDNAAEDKLVTSLNHEVAADIEGMSIYMLNGKNYLVVSSQGNNRYAVYAIDENHQYLGVFEVGANWSKFIDGASETDGLAVTHHNLGAQLPYGLLVVQDGHNVMPKATQNFKLVDGTLLREWILSRVTKLGNHR